jgi:Fe-Mn family superoxide dismutase
MFALPDLPYAYDDLEPVMSERTMRFHHDKHHAGYVNTLNTLLSAGGAAPGTLESVIQGASKSGEKKLFNNAAQAWNHSFFWEAMTPQREAPAGDLASAIDAAFGSLDGLKTAFVAEGAGHFGSGWVWLVADHAGQLRVCSTHDADVTLTQADMTPLLVCDLWEHAYYLDRQNDRKGFLEAWFDALPNWRFAASQYAAARAGKTPWRHPPPAPGAQPNSNNPVLEASRRVHHGQADL